MSEETSNNKSINYVSKTQQQVINVFEHMTATITEKEKKESHKAEQLCKQDIVHEQQLKNAQNAETKLDENLPLKDKIKHFYQDQVKDNVLVFFTILYAAYLFLEIGLTLKNFFYATYYIDWRYFSFSPLSILGLYLPFAIFIVSTAFRFWSYHRQRKFFLYLCLFNVVVYTTTVIFRMMYCIAIPLVARMPIVEGITPSMLVFLARLIICIPVTSFGIVVSYKMYFLVKNSITLDDILNFKITNYIDTRKNRKYLYDVKIVRNLLTGHIYTIREEDRFLHSLNSGTTGTGKTSMSLTTKNCDDYDKRVLNEDTRNRKLYQAIISGKAYLTGPVVGKYPDPSLIKARPGYEKSIEDILAKYRVCGLTCVAPNAGLLDDLAELLEARDITYNRIDPIFDKNTGRPKKGCRGFNPMYISPSLTGVERSLDYVKKATLLADVMQSLNEMKGKGDAYFIGVNRSVTTSFAMLLLLTYPSLHNGKQPHPGIMQDLINDFSRCQPYYEELCRIDTDNKYVFIKDFIQNDILGAGREKMWDQARGLRNLFNDFLMNPLYKDILCSEDSIDMDEMLSKGQITLVNYALELGQCDSVAFGLFFAISFNDAVLRRPGTAKTRLPHFYDIDEFPVLLHPQMEKCFSLFRQYRVAMTVAIQSLDQMDKSETTRYLKNVIMGNCAHHVVFGRCSASEMECYSKLSGVKYMTQQTSTTNQTSMSTNNPSISYSDRETLQETNVVSSSHIRNRNFQEVTVFSVVNGSIIQPFLGRMDFLKKKRKRPVKRFTPDWNKLLEGSTSDAVQEPPKSISEGIFFTSQGVINNIPIKQTNSYMFADEGHSMETADSYEYDDTLEDTVLEDTVIEEKLQNTHSSTPEDENSFTGIEI